MKEVHLAPTLPYEGDYVRFWVRARVLTVKALIRFTPFTMKGEGRRLLMAKYKKIPFRMKYVVLWDMATKNVSMEFGSQQTISMASG